MKKLLFFLIIFCGCSSQVQMLEDPKLKTFPSIQANSLAGKAYRIPEDLNGEYSILLIGYKQRTQFDIDRWIYGLLDSGVKVRFYELPTIAGMMPELVQDLIDNGMRSGIPKPDWDLVLTVYNDAEKIVNLLGNERAQSTYVVVLNPAGQIVWFYNQGYSARVMLELKSFLQTNK